MIRNSWTLANLCYITPNFNDHYLIQEILRASLNYASTNKEKVIANSLRALGYLLSNTDFNLLEKEILPQLNKSSIFLGKINPAIFYHSDKKVLSIDIIFRIISDSILDKSPKISWNACVTLGNII